jgi:hypothetical protein
MALRVISGILTIFLLFEGGATANNDDFELPPISSYEAHRFGLDSTNLTQLEDFFHPKFPREYKEPDKLASSIKALADYPIKPTFVNGALWHSNFNIEVYNNIAYVTMSEGLGIFDVSNPANPRLLTYYYMEHPVWDASAKYNVLVVTNGGSGGSAMEILNVGDPTHPFPISKYGDGQRGFGILYDGSYAFLCNNGYGPRIIDLDPPSTPQSVGGYGYLWDIWSLCKKVYMGYATERDGMFAIFDFTYYSAPRFVSQIEVPQEATSVAVRNNYAYVTSCGYLYKNSLKIIDVSDSLHPAITNSWNAWIEGQGPYAVKIVDSILYMTTYSGYEGPVVIASLSDPVNPQVLSYYRSFPYDHSTHTLGLDIDGNYCYVAHEHTGFSIGDVSDPTSPQQVGFFNPLGLNKPQSMWGILKLEIEGDRAYVFDEIAGLIILDISDPANPVVLGYDGMGAKSGLAIKGNYAFMGTRGMRIMDISDPANITLAATYSPPGYARDFVINGDLCYVADDTAGLQILDVTDPFNITRVGYYNADYYGGHEAYSIALKDSLALLGGYFGLQIINIKDPANPTPIGRAEFGQYCWDIKVRDNMVYLALDSTIASVDISNPEYPYIMKTISDYGDDPFNLCLYDNYLLVANLGGGGNQVEIYDISTPGDMIAAGVIPTAGHYATDVAAVGKYIYVADYYGLLVMDGDFPIMCGDADGSRKLDLLDISATIDYLYRGGSVPDPSALDVDGSGKANLLDISYLLRYLYLHGPAPRCGG